MKRPHRSKLILNRETLRQLDSRELAQAVGGSATTDTNGTTIYSCVESDHGCYASLTSGTC
jgi:hypothetical protein